MHGDAPYCSNHHLPDTACCLSDPTACRGRRTTFNCRPPLLPDRRRTLFRVLYFGFMNSNNVGETALPTRYGNFRVYFGFESDDRSDGALALVIGTPSSTNAPLVRIHSQCLT